MSTELRFSILSLRLDCIRQSLTIIAWIGVAQIVLTGLILWRVW